MEQLGPRTCYLILFQIATDSFMQVRSLTIITTCSGFWRRILGNKSFLEAHHKITSQLPMCNLQKEVLTCRFYMCPKEAELNNEVASLHSSRIFSQIKSFMVDYPNNLEFQKEIGQESPLFFTQGKWSRFFVIYKKRNLDMLMREHNSTLCANEIAFKF